MIIYVEEKIKNNKIVQKNLDIFKKDKNNDILYIKNYKNIFDKNFPAWIQEKILIFAKLTWSALLPTPQNYWPYKKSYFLKTSLNCIFDCKYCFLKWAFKNNFLVFFVNYNDIKKEIKKIIQENKKNETICFYSSDYSDNLATNNISFFVQSFVPFFERFKNTILEIRTKSDNIKPLLDLWFIPKNTEIAFSLSPQIIIDKYEAKTTNLQKRINTINTLMDKWFKVWLRFLPLLNIDSYLNIYKEFIWYIKQNIDISKINSISIWWLMYTKDDYKNMIKKVPDFDMLYHLLLEDDFFRQNKNVRRDLYNLFIDLDKNINICMDKLN